MQALVIRGYDGESQIAVEEVPAPVPGASDVVVRVAAAAVNPLDVKLARGYLAEFFPLAFPYVLGTDLAGTIEAVGRDVTGFRPGQQVVARTDTVRGGAFAELAAVPARLVTRLPETLSLDAAAALVTVGGTAWQALFEVARISPATRLLVTGGAGSVGGMAIRLASSIGARVFATARAGDMAAVRQLGAERVFDAAAELDVADLDLVLDTVGGDRQRALFGALREGGLFAAIPSPPDAAAGQARKLDVRFVFHEADGSRLALMTSYCAARELEPTLDRVMALASGRDAVARVAAGQARGKVVLHP